MSGLADVLAGMLAEQSAARPRSQQVELGPSNADGCRAEHVLRLNGAAESDPRLSWQAEVGTAIHELVLPLLAKAMDAEHEVHLTWRGVSCHVDLLGPPLLLDLKTTTSAGLMERRLKGPRASHLAQVNMYAAAAIDAGYDIRTVGLLYVPRDGDLTDAVEWLGEPDRTVADAAWERLAESGRLAVERAGLEPADMVNGLRDKPFWWCESHCPFFTACRTPTGEPPAQVDQDAEDAAAAYLAAKVAEETAKAEQKAARRVLERYADLRTVGLTWQERAGSVSVDVDAVRELWQEWEPLLGALPTRQGGSSRSLVRLKGRAL